MTVEHSGYHRVGPDVQAGINVIAAQTITQESLHRGTLVPVAGRRGLGGTG